MRRPTASACRDLVERAAAAGYSAVVVTVDLPLPGNRERDLRNDFVVELGVHLPPDQPVDPETGVVVLPTMDWDELAWLRSVCPVPLVAKGVLRADDASAPSRPAATASGSATTAAASSTPRSPPPMRCRRSPRRSATARCWSSTAACGAGSTSSRALALGADLVAVGRPALWGLAVDGADGVQRVLEILRDELSLAMALAGCRVHRRDHAGPRARVSALTLRLAPASTRQGVRCTRGIPTPLPARQTRCVPPLSRRTRRR